MKTIIGYIIEKLDWLVLELDCWYTKKYGKRYDSIDKLMDDLEK